MKGREQRFDCSTAVERLPHWYVFVPANVRYSDIFLPAEINVFLFLRVTEFVGMLGRVNRSGPVARPHGQFFQLAIFRRQKERKERKYCEAE